MGTMIGFLGSAFGTVGGVGGGGIFVPMLTLIIGFDAKSATAISKCKKTNIFAPIIPSSSVLKIAFELSYEIFNISVLQYWHQTYEG